LQIFAKLSNEMNDDDEGNDKLTSMPLAEFEPRVTWQQCLQAENTNKNNKWYMVDFSLA
jgi:hypothetical protein